MRRRMVLPAAAGALALAARLGWFVLAARPTPIAAVMARADELKGKSVRVAGEVRSGGEILP